MAHALPRQLLLVALFLAPFPLGAAELKLDAEGVRRAIAFGQRFDSQQKVLTKLAQAGHRKTIGGWYVFRDVFLITDFVRVAVHAAEARRRGEAVDAEAIQQHLSGQLDVLVLYDAEPGRLPAEPVLFLQPRGAGPYPASRTTRLNIFAGCETHGLPPGDDSPLYLDWVAFCRITDLAKNEVAVWVYTFSLAEDYQNSKIELVLTEDAGKVARKKFNLSRLR